MENGAKSAGDGFSETQKSAGKAAKSTTTLSKRRLRCRQRGENVVEMPVVVLLELLKQFVGIDGSQGTLSPPHDTQ